MSAKRPQIPETAPVPLTKKELHKFVKSIMGRYSEEETAFHLHNMHFQFEDTKRQMSANIDSGGGINPEWYVLLYAIEAGTHILQETWDHLLLERRICIFGSRSSDSLSILMLPPINGAVVTPIRQCFKLSETEYQQNKSKLGDGYMQYSKMKITADQNNTSLQTEVVSSHKSNMSRKEPDLVIATDIPKNIKGETLQ